MGKACIYSEMLEEIVLWARKVVARITWEFGFALFLTVFAHSSWADNDLSTPLHLEAQVRSVENQQTGDGKTQYNLCGHNCQTKTTDSTNSHRSEVHKKPPIINLQQSKRIRECLQMPSQTKSCEVIAANYAKHEIAMEEAAANANISPALLKAIVGIESHYNEKARSKMEAIGLMQLMPQTAIYLGLHRHSMRESIPNLNAGALHLRKLLDRFMDMEMAIAAYLLGENAIRNQVPVNGVTYVKNTLLLYNYFEGPTKPVGVRLEEM